MIADLGATSELDDLSEGNSSIGTKDSDSESTKSSEKEDLPEVKQNSKLNSEVSNLETRVILYPRLRVPL